MKNCKTFYEAQTVNHLKEIVQPPPPSAFLTPPSFPASPPLPRSPDKSFPRLSNKNVFTEIYRNTQTFAFIVLRECSSWASKNCCNPDVFFWHQPDFAVKFVNWERYLAVLCLFGHIFFKVKRVEFLEISEIFWAKRYCKIRYLFC